MRRLEGGERERHLRAMEDATSSPGRTRAASSATRSRPGPTTVKGRKAKMPRWRAARRGGVTLHAQGPANRARSGSHALPDRSGEIQAMRLVGAPSPSFARETEEAECGRPPGPEPQTGADIHLTQDNSL
jgi:hypothetical protein